MNACKFVELIDESMHCSIECRIANAAKLVTVFIGPTMHYLFNSACMHALHSNINDVACAIVKLHKVTCAVKSIDAILAWFQPLIPHIVVPYCLQ